MDKQDSYSANFAGLDYSLDQHQQSGRVEHQTSSDNNYGMVNYMINNSSNNNNSPQNQQQYLPGSGFGGSTSMDKLSFAEVMQFAEFGPKLALNQTKVQEEESGIDPVYFLKFPVLNDKIDQDEDDESLMVGQLGIDPNEERLACVVTGEDQEEKEARVSDSNNPVQLQFLGDQDPQVHKNCLAVREGKNKRKRARTIKTSEEVESQRMTHIAVERNRRKQMNEHLRVLRLLMPGSYVQRGDQASIIGGAIEFVRELEQLLQCLESQKRRRLYGDQPGPRQIGGDPSLAIQQPQSPFFPPMPLPNDPMKLIDLETGGLREETAETKSFLADVEVKLLGFDAMIKILSRRRPGQLIRTIAALEDLQLCILHTNITTIEQTVLYSFNVKITGESSCTAKDIASSVQQIFSFIHANSSI